MNRLLRDLSRNLYNPQAISSEQLLSEFLDRRGCLTRILEILRHNTPDRPQQHVMLLGPRGMGKTTLLCAIRHSVRLDEELSAMWLPLQFAEEQNNIGDLADFWLECLSYLEQTDLKRVTVAEQLRNENPADLAEKAQAAFFGLLATTGKRALLLVDNINDIFTNIDDGQALHKLRALWMTDPRMTVIGAAPSYFEEITSVDQAFHDFFRVFSLERLNQQELEDCLRRYAALFGDDKVLRVIEQAPERVHALRILTGGNPRLVKLGYRVLQEGLDGDLRQDLERLLDEATPFFKHRIDSLSKEARRTFDAIARYWDPVSVDDIRRELRKPSNYVSAQIKRLIDDGFVEEVSGDKKKRYQVCERFYNVYYLWRLSRDGRNRLRWLVGFMRTFYSRKDYQDWSKRLEKELSSEQVSEPVRGEKIAFLHAMCVAADGDERALVFETLVRDAVAHDRDWEIDDAAKDDPVEFYGWRYLAAEVLGLLDVETRRTLRFRPGNDDWWRRLHQVLGEAGLMQAQTRLEALGGWRQDTAVHAMAAGMMFLYLLKNISASESAIRKAIEINPQYISAWNNLGVTHNNQGRQLEAEVAFRKAIELDPQFVLAWNNLGGTLVNQNRYQEAEENCRKALELDPQCIDAWINLGESLLYQGRNRAAEDAYRKVFELDPHIAYAWNGLGVTLEKLSRYQEAEDAYLECLKLDPKFAYGHYNLAGLDLKSLGQNNEGLSHLIEGLSLAPQNNNGKSLLAQHWQAALPLAVANILNHQAGPENLREAITDTLLAKAASGKTQQVRDALLALEDAGQAIFEPLLLALQALEDRAILYRIAREKRDLVVDVMKRISGDEKINIH